MNTDNDITATRMFPKQPIFFRFCFILFLLFILLFNNHTFLFLTPFVPLMGDAIIGFMKGMTAGWLDLNQTVPYYRNGSGDSTVHWLILLLILLLSIIACIVWSLVDRKNREYPKLYYWLTVLLRYYVGITMFNYGVIKLFQGQFPFPTLYKLTEPLYQYSPMGLAWAFYGASHPYNIMIGIAEMLGVLLLFRKTMTIGAIITLGVSINVMATNYFYDVPVKMLSTTLVLFSLYLLGPNISKFYKLLIQGKAISLSPPPSLPLNARWKRISLISIKVIMLLATVAPAVQSIIRADKFIKQFIQTESDLYGVYYLPLREYENRKKLRIPDDWHFLIFINEQSLIVRDAEMKSRTYQMTSDSLNKEIKIIGKAGEPTQHFRYEKREAGIMLRNIGSKDSISIYINKIDMENIDLKTRGFRWVSDMPYNR